MSLSSVPLCGALAPEASFSESMFHEISFADVQTSTLLDRFSRAVFVTIDGKGYKFLKAITGLRDLGAAFGGKVLDVMNSMGASLGKFSICAGHWKAINTHLTCRVECLFEANTACLVRAMGV